MKNLITFFIMLCSITLYSQDTIVKRALRSPYLLDWSLITNDTISYLLGLDGKNIYKGTSINNNLSVTGTSVFTKQISVTMYTQSYATPAMTIDFNNSNNQKVILTGDTTDITFSNGSSGAIYRLLIYQDGTGGRLLTYANAKFPGGVAPVLTSTLNALDILTFVFDGTNYNCIGFATDLK